MCFRLWDEAETGSLPQYAEPEIRSSDLSPLLLDCADWGVTDRRRSPGSIHLQKPRSRRAGGAYAFWVRSMTGGAYTELGSKLRRLPLPPRLASMVIEAARCTRRWMLPRLPRSSSSAGSEAWVLRSIIVSMRSAGDRSKRATDMRRLAEGWARAARENRPPGAAAEALSTAGLLALAFPDRIARARGASGQFVLAGGRGASLDATDALARSRFLVVGDMQGAAQNTRILLAAETDERDVMSFAQHRIVERDELTFDREALALRARRVRRLGAIELLSDPKAVAVGEAAEAALAAGIAQAGVARLPWTRRSCNCGDRVAFLRGTRERLGRIFQTQGLRPPFRSGWCRFSRARRVSRHFGGRSWPGSRYALAVA